MAAARSGQYSAIVHTDPNWPAQRAAFETQCRAWGEAMRKPVSGRATLEFHGLGCEYECGDLSLRRDLSTLGGEIERMGRMLNGIGGHKRILGLIDSNKNFGHEHEPHDHPVLNRTLFGAGTILRRRNGDEIGAVKEGDYLYMAPGLSHYSTYHEHDPQRLDRLSLIVFPSRVTNPFD